MPSLFYLTAFLYGLCIGSFLNVCIYRLPRSLSVVYPPSRCPKCKKNIVWYENIPILSYLFLKGKCSGCGKEISLRYPLVELITGILVLALFKVYGISISFFYYTIFCAGLIVVSFIDLDYRIIPDVISLPGIAWGIIGAIFVPELEIKDSLFGVLLGGGILFAVAWGYFLITKREGMGGGDIKLLAMIGAFLGWKAIPVVLFVASLTGTLAGLFILVCHKTGRQTQIPFGPFLSLGAFFYLFAPIDFMSITA